MLCKYIRDKRIWWAFIFVGAISLVFGIVAHNNLPEDVHHLDMLMGMFSGAGAALVGIGIVQLIRLKLMPAEKLKREEIELKDERNVQLLQISFTISSVAATILLAIMAFLFVGLNYQVPAYICIAAVYLQLIVFLIVHRHYSKKM